MKRWIPLHVDEPVKIQEVGGKALSLILMTQKRFQVPPGFVLSVSFFEPWYKTLAESPQWQAAQTADGPALTRITEALQSQCQALRFTGTQQEALESALRTFPQSQAGQLFAVRSSSPDEDLENASFAGGYETRLGVTVAMLENAIRDSFASLFDKRVFLYKREHGIATSSPRIAVIIQQQVDADSAGVAFSLNPLNNCYDEVLINANYGLGETVVSGTVDSDQFVIDRRARNVIETKVGKSGLVTHLNSTGGVIQSQRSAETGASLTEEQALGVADLAAQVEAAYEKPMDIEWAYSGGELYLLQARPITTYLPLPPEMITQPGEPKKLYANSTLIEQGLQEPLSVLGTDFLSYVLSKVGGGVSEGAVGPDGVTFTAGGGYYMNISYAMKMGMKNAALAPGSFGDPRVMAILDSIDMREYTAVEIPKRLQAMRSKMIFSLLPMARSVLNAYLRPQVVLQNYQKALPAQLEKFKAQAVGRSLHEQAVALTNRLTFFYGDYGIPMILAGQIAQQRIKSLFKQEAAEVQDHLINLGVALPGNKTTEMGEMMYALAASETIRRYDSAAAFTADLQAKRLPVKSLQMWDSFMAEFGMRCPGEIDVATPRPEEQPAQFFEQLKSMALSVQSRGDAPSFFEEARAKREAAYAALHALALKKGRSKAQAFEKYYKTWLTFGGYRETPKHYVIQVIDLFRQQALTIGRVFALASRLDVPEQIFQLTIADIDRAQADPTLDLRAIAQERSQLTEKIRRSRLTARIIDSRGRIFYPPRQLTTDGALAGVPISPGIARGRVKVFHHSNEKQLLPGEILVARATDPGWTPLFINARGIILEIGGALQHGAVVAREYGIPCVSGLDRATELLSDGQMVEVDGSNGTVRILESDAL